MDVSKGCFASRMSCRPDTRRVGVSAQCGAACRARSSPTPTSHRVRVTRTTGNACGRHQRVAALGQGGVDQLRVCRHERLDLLCCRFARVLCELTHRHDVRRLGGLCEPQTGRHHQATCMFASSPRGARASLRAHAGGGGGGVMGGGRARIQVCDLQAGVPLLLAAQHVHSQSRPAPSTTLARRPLGGRTCCHGVDNLTPCSLRPLVPAAASGKLSGASVGRSVRLSLFFRTVPYQFC